MQSVTGIDIKAQFVIELLQFRRYPISILFFYYLAFAHISTISLHPDGASKTRTFKRYSPYVAVWYGTCSNKVCPKAGYDNALVNQKLWR